MTKSKMHVLAMVLLVGVIIFLGIVWWVNGRDDTWLYATCVVIVLSSIFSIVSERNSDRNK